MIGLQLRDAQKHNRALFYEEKNPDNFHIFVNDNENNDAKIMNAFNIVNQSAIKISVKKQLPFSKLLSSCSSIQFLTTFIFLAVKFDCPVSVSQLVKRV